MSSNGIHGNARRHSSVAATLALSLAALIAGCRSAVTAPPSALVAEITAAAHELEARFAAGDLLGVANLYADDASLVGPNGYRVQGRASIDDYWSRITDPVEWKLITKDIEGSAGVATQRGTSRLTYRWDGELQTSEVEFLLIWQLEADGGWKVLIDAYWSGPQQQVPALLFASQPEGPNLD